MNNNEYRVGVNRGLPVGMGYFSVSFGFGAMAVSQGLKTLDAVLISATNLTSAGQFAGLTLIVAAATLWEMVLTQLVINSRYALMSLALSQRMGERIGLLPRLLIAFFNTDEIFALAMAREAPLTVPFLLGLGTLPFIGWTLGTLCGALAGSILPLSIRTGAGGHALRHVHRHRGAPREEEPGHFCRGGAGADLQQPVFLDAGAENRFPGTVHRDLHRGSRRHLRRAVPGEGRGGSGMNIYLYILAMALTTYLIRVLPMTIFRKPIKSRFLRSFLYYVPYCCLTAMTFPSILSSTASILSGAAALVVAVILAYRGKSLIVVALSSSAAVLVVEWAMSYL